jgi:preprotein translocase subunit YajC
MFINQAFAQTVDAGTAVAADATAAAGSMPGIWAQLLPLVLIFFVFYFLLIRPQQKKLKAHVDMVSALRRGDKVVLGGGIIGSISRIVDDKEVLVEIAPGTEVRVVRSAIAELWNKTPVAAADNPGKAA